MPNPGYDSITVHPPFGFGNDNIFPINKQKSTSNIMTNGTITVNTTNMDPQCNLECYTGCRVLFPEFIEQKYCIINVCKCIIIEKDVVLPENINNNNNTNNTESVQIVNSEIHKYSTTAFVSVDKNKMNLSENFKNEKNYFYWIFYFFIFLVSFGYEYYIWNYISNKNGFSLVEWVNEKNDIKYKKYRMGNENEFENNNNDELRACLL